MSSEENRRWREEYETGRPVDTPSAEAPAMSDSAEGEVEGYEYVPPGKYNVAFQCFDLISPRGLRGRLRAWFLIEDGEYAGIEIPWFAPVTIVDLKRKRYKCRRNSKLLKTLESLTDRKFARRDRVSIRTLGGMALTASIVTVQSRQDGSSYDDEEAYSKVESLNKGYS